MERPRTIDELASAAHHSAMAHAAFRLTDGQPRIVGSFAGADDFSAADPADVRESCHLAEARLDLLAAESDGTDSSPWRHLIDIPLLFTARRIEEGGALPLSAAERMNLLERVLDEAALIDIEVASIDEMKSLLSSLASRGTPWIASFHDFKKLPESKLLEKAAKLARDAGAHAFKAAAFLHSPADLARLAEFQLADHGLPVATMGMGPLAPVSRLLCAQCGSVLNYGYIGKTPTAPGQWDAAMLKQAVTRLAPFRA